MTLHRKNIALVAGGYSGEYEVSLGSADTIEKHLDKDKYAVYRILITREGWYYTGDDGRRCSVDRNDFSLPLPEGRVTFDAVFIGIHGTPGEDGRLQGYFDMLGLPYTSSGAITSGITFNKAFCNRVVAALGAAKVSRSVHVFRDQPFHDGQVFEKLRFPVFVKPAEGGSSLGISKVDIPTKGFRRALETAFAEDQQVLIEEYIRGREITCGLFCREGDLQVLPLTEVISRKPFFDYEAKYTPGMSEEVTPAQLEPAVAAHIGEAAEKLYRGLNCRGLVRMDFILEEGSGDLYFLEANTMPGQSENSIVPKQVRAAGMTLQDFYGILIEECLR